MPESINKLNIVIINRTSVVSGSPLSRSVEERLYEPMLYLKNRGLLNFQIFSESEWRSIKFEGLSHILLNRAHNKDSLDIAREGKRLNIKLINDLDDIPVYFPVTDKAYLNFEKQNFFHRILQEVDVITCSTHKIQEWVKRTYPLKENSVIQTGFDFSRIDQKTKKPIEFHHKTILFTNAGSIKLGSFGIKWLKVLEEVLLAHGWKLGVFADTISEFPKKIPLDYYGSVPWFEHKTKINHAFPLAIVPLASNEDVDHLLYSQYKTPVKYFINGGLGVPTIYSKSPIYESCITENVNGVLVENDVNSWRNALDKLIVNSELRTLIAKNAETDVRLKNDISTTAAAWLSLLQS